MLAINQIAVLRARKSYLDGGNISFRPKILTFSRV